MGIALTETTGLQSGTFGWVEFADEHKVVMDGIEPSEILCFTVVMSF